MLPDIQSDAAQVAYALNDVILAHLGRVLAKAYAAMPDESAKPDQLEALTEKLCAALSVSGRRDAAEFREGLLAASPALLRFAKSLTHDPSEADDLLQDTMLRAWRSQDSFVAGTKLQSWLFTIMRNGFYSKYRKQRLEVSASEEDGLLNATTLPDQAGVLDLADMQKALQKLPAVMREALLLVTVECLTYEEAAAVMECEIGTVKSRVCRGRAGLVQLLGFNGAEVGNGSDMLGALNRYGAVASTNAS